MASRVPDGPVAVAGVASLAVRDLLRGSRRHGKVLAVLPQALCLEFGDAVPEPRVIVVSPPDAIRLPNAVVTGPVMAWPTRPSAECWAGEDRVLACGLDIRAVRWWDPSPVFGPLSRARLPSGRGLLEGPNDASVAIVLLPWGSSKTVPSLEVPPAAVVPYKLPLLSMMSVDCGV